MAGDFTAAVWLYIEAGNSAMMNTAIFFTPESQNYTRAYINNNGTLNVAFGDNYTEYLVNVVSAWHHIVFVKNGNSYNIYYDGAFIASHAIGPYYSTDWTWFDGAMSDWLSPRIDELIFYDKALTPSQVTDLFTSYDGPNFAALTYEPGYFTPDMGYPGACSLQYSSRMYLEGAQIGSFPSLVNNNPNFQFSGWRYTQGDILDEYAQVYDGMIACASWVTASPVSVLYFDTQGGSSVMEYWDLYEGFTFEIPYLGHYWPADPTYEGYVFAGWYSSTGGTGYPITGQTIFESMIFGAGYTYAFAYWTLPPITFTFTSGVPPYGGGTAQTDIPGIENYATIEYFSADFASGAEITALPSASVPGPRYSFSGYWWEPYYATVYYSGIYAPLNNEPFGGPIPLYALWTDNGYQGQVTFDLQGGSGETPVINLFEGYVFSTGDFGQTVWPATPTYDGYTFAGWWTEVGGTGNLIEYDTTWTYASYPLSVTLYAYWIAN
jgi:hypothetical protein